jgi:hypothetical protein
MKSNELKKRLQKDRTMIPVSIRMPEDVVDNLKKIAPQLGFSGYQPLIRAYVGQGLRQDLARLESSPNLEPFIESLRRHGVTEEVIASYRPRPPQTKPALQRNYSKSRAAAPMRLSWVSA